MRGALAAILGAAALLAIAGPAGAVASAAPGDSEARQGTAVGRAGEVTIVVVDTLDLDRLAPRAAVGLLVPGAGETVTRAGALSALLTGRATASRAGGVTTGAPVVTVSRQPGRRATVYVVLPPEGRTSNTRRYPVAVVGAGFRGLLTSTSTRIPGLVSVTDIAPTVVALRAGTEPPLGWREVDDAPGEARALDRRLDDASEPRDVVTISLVVTALALALAGLALRSPLLARATPVAPLCSLGTSLVLSAVGLTDPTLAIVLAFGLTVPLAIAVAAHRLVAAWALAGFLCAYLVLLAASPQTAALAVIGPHPESGGRFYGVTNLIETFLLVATVAVIAVAPLLPSVLLAAIALVTVGWSEAGADGGGILVLGAAYATVVLLRRRGRLRPRDLVGAGLLIVVGATALVLVDRLAGGSSHVTRAVGDGPGAVVSDIGHRLSTSWHVATGNAHTIAICLVALAGIAIVLTRLPRTTAVVAVAVGLAVSLLVNDSPPDVLVASAIGLGGLAIEAWAVCGGRGARPSPSERVFADRTPGDSALRPVD